MWLAKRGLSTLLGGEGVDQTIPVRRPPHKTERFEIRRLTLAMQT